MPAAVVIGSQWGDEGKGKIIDRLSQSAQMTVRYSGGDNAGHSIVVGNQNIALRLVPSGILNHDALCVISNGTVINPTTLLEEIKTLNQLGIPTDHLRISDRAHVIFPYHILQDQQQEIDRAKNGEKIGTTNKGIGPAYMDKMQRIGIRMVDLLEPETLESKIEFNLQQKKSLLGAELFEQLPSAHELANQYLEFGKTLKPLITDTSYLINEELHQENKVLLEGAQGSMLDIDHGTYPFVTSSNPTAGGASTGTGIGPKSLDHIIGVCKAYVSRVGAGPFPTEQLNSIGDQIRETAHEYGTVTHRPRRIGWFDGVLLKYVAQLNGFTDLVVNCLDVLSGFETVKICTGYEVNGNKINYYPASDSLLEQAQPIYRELPGWSEDLTQIKSFDELPLNAQKFLQAIEEVTETRISAFSVGPDREQTVEVNQIW